MNSTTPFWATALLACSSFACSKPPPTDNPTPGHAAPSARVIAPKPAAKGEAAVDVAKSSISLNVIKDREMATPVVIAVSVRDGAVALGASPPSARLSIDLDSLDSAIPLRNERIRSIFFETSGKGWETGELIIPSIPADVVQALREKKMVSHAKLEGTLKLHGRVAPITLIVDAGITDGGRMWVKSASPVPVTVAAFGLSNNLRRLSSICMHDSIDDLVNVTASFEFAAP